MNRLQAKYTNEIKPVLKKTFGFENDMQIPKLTKLVVNVGVTDAQHRDKAVENVSNQLSTITGQKPAIRRARQSIAGFKLREGDLVGVSVTLRGEKMYQFLDKVISAVLPRVKDFQGIPPRSFDGGGNYNFGIREQIIFPEIDYDKIDSIRGMQLTLVTSTNDDKVAFELLKLLGLPFEKVEEGK